MKKILLVIFLSVLNYGYSQNELLDEYPAGQYFYAGGQAQFYKEAHDLLFEKKVQECADNQIYVSRIIITKEAKIKLVTDPDEVNVAKNKCAYDISITLLKGLKNWVPAEVKGNVLGAVAEFVVYPKDIMSNYKEGYRANDFVSPPSFPGGEKKFEDLYHDTFYSLFQDYAIQGRFDLEYFINENGELVNPRMFPALLNQQFNLEFLRTFNRLKKKKWNPALYKEVLPIKYKVIRGMDFSVKYYTN